jgi:cytidyltransferase-like protein
MVFGTFDPFHPGHQNFLEQAQAYGDQLIVVVTPDSIIKTLKHRDPHQSESRRLDQLQHHGYTAILGDSTLGSYSSIHTYKPTVICCGHDQEALVEDLRERMRHHQIPESEIIMAKPYLRHLYCSTQLRPT